MENSVQVLSNQIQIKEWAGQRVITFQDIDTVHQRPRGTASRNFRENRDKFIEDTDFFSINLTDDEIRRQFGAGINAGRTLTLLTESGYLMIVKSLHDDLAWTVQRLLVNCYFKVKQEAAAPVEETTTTVSLVNHETILRAAAIMATCPDSTRYVVNLLRNIDPNIDQTPTVTVQMEDKPIEIPKLPEPEAAVVKSTRTSKSRCEFFNYRKLQKIMKERRLYNTDLAQRISVDPSTVSTWRSGACPPNSSNRQKLCAALGVAPAYFDN